MGNSILHVILTAFGLSALVTCVGVLVCRIWILPPSVRISDPVVFKALFAPLWRLLAACIAGLIVSSIGELATRTAEMSGRSIAEISPILLTVLLKTHYGHVWLVRLLALAALWVGWQIGKKGRQSYATFVPMLSAGIVITITRSASGHSADWGDLTFPELMDWLHLMAVSAWGGGLLVLSAVILPTATALSERRRGLIADIARRFSTLAGIAFGTLVVTAMYNAWLQVGSFQAFWNNTYGIIVTTKLLLLLGLAALGASNRYISVPLLQQWAGRPMIRRGFLYHLLVTRYFTPFRPGLDGTRVARRFIRKLMVEAILVIAGIICAACLLHSIPARHFSHIQHQGSMQKATIEYHHHLPETP